MIASKIADGGMLFLPLLAERLRFCRCSATIIEYPDDGLVDV